jgi:hypothetical protein
MPLSGAVSTPSLQSEKSRFEGIEVEGDQEDQELTFKLWGMTLGITVDLIHHGLKIERR